MTRKLAFVGNSLYYMYNFRMGVLNRMVELGYDVTIIAVPDCDIKNDKINSNIRFIPINLDRKGLNPFSDIALEKQLYKIYIQEKFDYIFHYTIKTVIYGSVAARKAGIPQLSVITGLGYSFLKDNLLKHLVVRMYRYALKTAEQVWFLNEDDKSVFLQKNIISQSRAHVINGEGVDTDYFAPSNKQKNAADFKFLLIGRVMAAKGLYEYAEAARIVHKQYPKVQFCVLGNMSKADKDSIDASQVQQWVDAGDIVYLGSTSDVRPAINECNCVVLPSYREGVPRTLLEASSMQKPIIATNVTGCREVVEDGVNGMLVEAKSASSLAQAMLNMLTMPQEELCKMGQKGREMVIEKFDEKSILQVYEEFINDRCPIKARRQLNISFVLYNNQKAEILSLLNQIQESDVINRIFLIDNSPTPILSQEELKAYSLSVEYVFNNKNLGYGKAHNIALRRSVTEGVSFHLVANSDIKFDADGLWKMVKYMKLNPDVGILVPKVYYPDGDVQYLCKLLPTPFDLFRRRFMPHYKNKSKDIERFEMLASNYDHTMNVPFISGCFMMLSIDAVRNVGYFDERYFMYAEDIDYSRRMHHCYKTLFWPEVNIVHNHTAASYHDWHILLIHIISVCKYFNKWGWIFDSERKKVNQIAIENMNNSKL